MDIVYETLAFAAKGFIIFATIVATALVVFGLSRRRRGGGGARLHVRLLNERFEALGDALRHSVLQRKDFRQLMKERKKAKPAKPAPRPSVYVLDFKGDILATAVKSLREEVTAITAAAAADDEVVVRLESPGGAVPHYGLAAAQLLRLKEKKLKVTVCIDRVAASGGYMMACIADTIVAAPFSSIGSIGVVAQVPNVHQLLKKHDVEFNEMTAGEFKRTVSIFGEITDKGRQKFQDQLEDTHALFKEFVKAQRPKLDVNKVATGEYWLALRAIELGLVDQISTSDDYLIRRAPDANVYRVTFQPESTLREKLGRGAAATVDRVAIALLTRVMSLQLR
ncbi:MAG: peptidase family protein [Myxococcaceae bacterium]|nr:peptidase family protein [Myxococcaceae bacterium]